MRLLTREQLAEYVGRPVKTIDSWRFKGRAGLRLRTRRQGGPRFSLEDLEAWQEAVERAKEKGKRPAVKGQTARAHKEATMRLRARGYPV